MEALESRVVQIVRDVCECSHIEIPLDQPLRELEGWDSMRAVNFQIELESVFSVDLSDFEITGRLTIIEILAILRGKSGGG